MNVKEAIKDLEEMKSIEYRPEHKTEVINTVLSELEKKDKIIDEMSKYVNSPLRIPEEKYCEFYHSDADCCWKTDRECKDCIKDYFTKKCEGK